MELKLGADLNEIAQLPALYYMCATWIFDLLVYMNKSFKVSSFSLLLLTVLYTIHPC